MGSTQFSSQRSARVELGELSEISHIWVRMVFRGKAKEREAEGTRLLWVECFWGKEAPRLSRLEPRALVGTPLQAPELDLLPWCPAPLIFSCSHWCSGMT